MRQNADERQFDELDAALDRLSISPDGIDAPDWLLALNDQLSRFDRAFASQETAHEDANRKPSSGNSAGYSLTPPPVHREGASPGRLPVSGWLLAAALAVLAFGLGLFGANHGWWTDNDNRPTGASIAAVSSPRSTSYVDEMVVTPSTCTLEPLTREQYEAIVGTATPLTQEDFYGMQVALTNQLLPLLDLRVVNGSVLITGGGAVPREMADEIERVLSIYMACGNDGKLGSGFRIFSDSLIARLPDRDQFLAALETPSTPEVKPPLEMQVSQLRLLPDGRIVLIWTFVPPYSPEPEYEFFPEATPHGTVALKGVLLVFVQGTDGWQLDFHRGGENFRLQLNEEADPPAGTPTSVDEMVVTPSTCTLEPLTRERYDEVIRLGTPIADSPALVAAKTSELREALELTVIDGTVVIAAGSSLPNETAASLEVALSGYMACGNAGDNFAMFGFMSDDYIRMIPDPDSWFGQVEAYETPIGGVKSEWRFEQVRLLPDGRVVAVVNKTSQETAMFPAVATPDGTVASQSMIYLFVDTPDGWRHDFAQSGSALLARAPDSETASPESTFTLDFVVQALTCSLPASDSISSPTATEISTNQSSPGTVELFDALDLRVGDGTIEIAGGGLAPSDLVDEVMNGFSSFLRCGSDGNDNAARKFLSADFVASNLQPDDPYYPLRRPDGSTFFPIDEIYLEQFRVFEDSHRLVAVWRWQGLESSPATPGSTPHETIILVFIETPDGWKLDTPIRVTGSDLK